MKKEEIIADLALRELKEKEQLKTVVHRLGYQHYLQGGIIAAICWASGVGVMLLMLLKESAPLWGFMVFGLAFISLLETTRQKERFNALLKLTEMEKTSEQELGQVSSETAVSDDLSS